MRKLALASIVLFTTLFATSCLKDAPIDNSWQTANTAAFNAWRDSANVHVAKVDSNRGGGEFIYRILHQSTDANAISPIYTDSIHVHYKGRFYNGVGFDSTYKYNAPNDYDRHKFAKLRINNVVRGWQEVLPLMKEGDKWKVILPFNLGYGTSANGNIPAYSTLIFDIELVKVVR